ncbi:hypothetical protein BGZ98_010259 [Dissophora globulifera]|nr:hypothetical protein BGZ98_010259 [Dissophora globulifera]
MSSDMASPPIQFESDPVLMAGSAAPGSTYGGYQSIYGGMNGNSMGFGHAGSYPVPNPATPPSLPPMHNSNPYAPAGNFQFSYHGDAGSAPPTSSGVSVASVSAAPLNTPNGQVLDAQHSPHAQQMQPSQLTPPQQHPQTPQQQQQQQQQPLQRQAHPSVNNTQSPYQPSPQAHHPGMPNLAHGHAIYPGDARYDNRLPHQRYMDPSMQPMMNRNGSRDMTWAQPNGMIPDLLGTNHPGGIRNIGGPQSRVPVKQQGMAMNGMGGMAMNGMNGMGGMGGLSGIPGMPGMNAMGGDRMPWGGMVAAAPQSPYGHGPHTPQPMPHQQQFHQGLQQHPFQQPPHLLHHQQGMQQHMGVHGRPGALAPVAGGGISKKKLKKPIIPVVKDKNCPKRPRNSYIFFTLMKRDDIKKKHPEFKPTEITKMLGEEWQKLSESEKENYGSMAENDKKRYQSEMETYDANGGANAAANAGSEGGNNQNGGAGNVSAGPGGEMNNEPWRG